MNTVVITKFIPESNRRPSRIKVRWAHLPRHGTRTYSKESLYSEKREVAGLRDAHDMAAYKFLKEQNYEGEWTRGDLDRLVCVFIRRDAINTSIRIGNVIK